MSSTPNGPPTGESPDLDERLRYTRIGPSDRERLSRMETLFDAEAGPLVERFYEHLAEHPEMRRLLGDEATVERLKAHQEQYVRGLADVRFGRELVDERRRIGEIHERIGLTPAWYIGMYSVYFDHLVPRLLERDADDPGGDVQTLAKRLLLDMQLVLDVYSRRRERTVVSHAEQLAAVGRLAAGVAHEVRNPLAGIRGALQVMQRDTAVPEGHREVMGEVVGQIDRLENLVRDLLTYARPRGVRRTPIELRTLFERHAEGARGAGTSIVTRVDVDDRADRLQADAEQLEQVMLNLVQNAVQAMPEGGALTLGSRRRGERIELIVRDSGTGMSERDLAAAFTPFFTTRTRGSGLGLSIVEGIVQRHGGRVAIESAPGSGTTVVLAFPVRPED